MVFNSEIAFRGPDGTRLCPIQNFCAKIKLRFGNRVAINTVGFPVKGMPDKAGRVAGAKKEKSDYENLMKGQKSLSLSWWMRVVKINSM